MGITMRWHALPNMRRRKVHTNLLQLAVPHTILRSNQSMRIAQLDMRQNRGADRLQNPLNTQAISAANHPRRRAPAAP
jgi:hypothetical protein